MPNDSKHIQASLSLIPTDWLRLRVAQVSRCRDLAIFVVTTDGQMDKTNRHFTLAHARGVIDGHAGIIGRRENNIIV